MGCVEQTEETQVRYCNTYIHNNNNSNNNNSIYLSTINYNAAKLMWSCQLKYPNTPIPTPITYAPKSLKSLIKCYLFTRVKANN